MQDSSIWRASESTEADEGKAVPDNGMADQHEGSNEPVSPNWGPPARRPVIAGTRVGEIQAQAPVPPPAIPPPPIPMPPPTPQGLGQFPMAPRPLPDGPPHPTQGDGTSEAGQRPERALPALTGPLFFGLLIAAFLVNLALQQRIYSLVFLVATTVIGTLILSGPSRRRVSIYGPVLLAVAGAAVMLIRSSPWVTVPAFLVVVGSLLVASQDRLLAGASMARVIPNVAADAIIAVGWLLSPVARLTRAGSGNGAVVRGCLLAAVVVVPLVLLLASADAVFGELLLSTAGEGFWGHVLLTGIVLPIIGGLVLASRQTDLRPSELVDRTSALKPASMTEGTIVLSSVAVVLGAWGATQVLVALGGADRLLSTDDLTAAQNARQGYFQMMAATALLVAVLMAVDRFVERNTSSEHRRFMVLTALIGLETLGVVSASYSRLSLYIQGFGHTMLRTSVAWFLGWLAVMLVVVIVSMNRRLPSGRSGGHLPLTGWVYLLAALWVVAFGIFNPERFVAVQNLEHRVEAGLDGRYLTERLGSDAVPAIVARIPAQGAAVQVELTDALCEQWPEYHNTSLAGWNRSLSQADESIHTLNCP